MQPVLCWEPQARKGWTCPCPELEPRVRPQPALCSMQCPKDMHTPKLSRAAHPPVSWAITMASGLSSLTLLAREHRLGVGGKGREGNAFPGFRRPLWLWGEAGTDWEAPGTLLPALPRDAVAGLGHEGRPRPRSLAGPARAAQPVGTAWWGHGRGTPLPPPAPHPGWDAGAAVSI